MTLGIIVRNSSTFSQGSSRRVLPVLAKRSRSRISPNATCGHGLLAILMSVTTQFRPPVARRYKRYIVTGSATFRRSGKECRGALLNVGQGGVLVRPDSLYREGPDLSLLFQVVGYPETVATPALIVGTKTDLLAIKFRQQPAGIDTLLRWLEQENCTWSGVA